MNKGTLKRRYIFKSLALLSVFLTNLPVFPQTNSLDIPYDLKGDQLGMKLADFKSKYHHIPAGDFRPGPFCSDDYPAALGTEASDAGMGVEIFRGIDKK
jgi:hypothetical protein